MRVFYSHDSLVTVLKRSRVTRIFRKAHSGMALKHLINDASQTDLLATDNSDSPLAVSERLLKQLAFTPFGYTPRYDTSVVAFKGERQDPHTQHYLLGKGYRGFNPKLMRFNSPDSFSPFARGGLNSYAFVGNDPINFSDPSGHNRQGFLRGLSQVGRRVWNSLSNAAAGVDPYKPSVMLELLTVNNTADNIVRGTAYYNGELVDVIYSHGTPGFLHGLNLNQDVNYGLKDVSRLLPKGPKRSVVMAVCYGAAVGPEGTSMAQAVSDYYGVPVLASEDKMLFNEVPVNSPPSSFKIYHNFNSAPAHLEGISTSLIQLNPTNNKIRGGK